MNRRNRVFLGILVLFALAVGVVLHEVVSDLDTRYRESAEETLVDTAYLFAAWIQADAQQGLHNSQAIAQFHQIFDTAYKQRLEAKIYDFTKSQVDLRAYITDNKGIVVFDSKRKSEGKNFSAWHDVQHVLQGRYGVRTTPDIPGKPETAIMYVAAPIMSDQDIIGVVSVGKPVSSLAEFVAGARQKLVTVGLVTTIAFIFLIIVVSVWLTRPQEIVDDLWRIVKQEIYHPERLQQRIMTVLKIAYRDMRDTLAGRSYTEEYVQALTHEIKSPLTAIRGAAELLKEPMTEAQRQRFADNINEQVLRLQDLADRLLELASLEKRRSLEGVSVFSLKTIIHEVIEALEHIAMQRKVVLQSNVPENFNIEGDAFLIHRAISNLVSNAIDFSPENTVVNIAARLENKQILLEVRDTGAGIPNYALDHVFEKFYSLRRPHSGRKSTGLGLAFVREIVQLHGGRAYLSNHPEGGALATIIFPITIIPNFT